MVSHEHQIFVHFLAPNMQQTLWLSLKSYKYLKLGKRRRYIQRDWQASILEDSCKSKHKKIQNSSSKFEQCSGVCIGKQEFCFFGSNAVMWMHSWGVRKPHGKQFGFHWICLKFGRSISGRPSTSSTTIILKNV